MSSKLGEAYGRRGLLVLRLKHFFLHPPLHKSCIHSRYTTLSYKYIEIRWFEHFSPLRSHIQLWLIHCIKAYIREAEKKYFLLVRPNPEVVLTFLHSEKNCCKKIIFTLKIEILFVQLPLRR